MYGMQKTLAGKVSCTGIGLHTGVPVNITMYPAKTDSGIVFVRTDVDAEKAEVRAFYTNVTNTMLGTTLSNENGTKVSTVEHLMAALWGCGVDNVRIEIDGPEVPIMDGSSEPFVFLIDCVGVVEQDKARRVIEVLKEIKVSEGDSEDSGFITITPSDSFSVGLKIDFGDEVIAKQAGHFDPRDISFKNGVCRARTFGFEHEVEMLRKNGLARGGSLENAIVVGKDGVLNEDGLRYSDEFVRHKILDCIGDIYLAGVHIKGHLSGFKSGHGLNNQLLREFFADSAAWREIGGSEYNGASC